jgi:hypothetical protein
MIPWNDKRMNRKMASLERQYNKLNRVREGFKVKPGMALMGIIRQMEKLTERVGKSQQSINHLAAGGNVFEDTSRNKEVKRCLTCGTTHIHNNAYCSVECCS